MSRSGTTWLCLALLFVACGGETDSTNAGDPAGPADGSEGGACYGNGTCDEGLVCSAALCGSDEGPDADASAADTGDESDADTAQTTLDSSSGDMDAGPADTDSNMDAGPADTDTSRTSPPGGPSLQPCASSKDCLEGEEVCDKNKGICVQCLSDDDCADGVCDVPAGACVPCLDHGHCEGDENLCVDQVCVLFKACASDNECTPQGMVCNTAWGLCMECFSDADCGDGEHCSMNPGEEVTCPEDCSGVCGNGVCDGTEEDSCPEDCTICGNDCGDNQSCSEGGGCIDNGPGCGDGLCLIAEQSNCPIDCVASCGDGSCGSGQPSTCRTAICGDLIVEADEQCDTGDAALTSCAYGETSCAVCSPDCKVVPGATSYCGDTKVDVDNGEECDEANNDILECPEGEIQCTVCYPACVEGPGWVPGKGSGSVVPPSIDNHLYIELSWTSLSGEFIATDLDLHMAASLSYSPFDVEGSTWWGSPNSYWNDLDPAALSRPRLGRDSVVSANPEAAGAEQELHSFGSGALISVHLWNDYGFGPSLATIRVFVQQALVYEAVDVELGKCQMWEVALVQTPSFEVTELESTDGGPSILLLPDPVEYAGTAKFTTLEYVLGSYQDSGYPFSPNACPE